MQNEKKSFINLDKKKYFWLFWIFAFLFLVVAIMILPFWKDFTFSNGKHVFFANYGKGILCICLSIAMFSYIGLVLQKTVRNEKQHIVVRWLSIAELILMILIGLLCLALGVLSFIYTNKVIENKFLYKVLNANHLSSIIIGLVLYIRGIVGIFGAYFYDKNDENVKKYPIWYLLMYILLLTIGSCLIFASYITDTHILYIFFTVLVLCFAFCVIIGILKKPVKEKKNKDEIFENATKEESEFENSLLEKAKEEETLETKKEENLTQKENEDLNEPIDLNQETENTDFNETVEEDKQDDSNSN